MARLLVIVERWSWREATTRTLHGGIKANSNTKATASDQGEVN
jgi:hypothetical protein